MQQNMFHCAKFSMPFVLCWSTGESWNSSESFGSSLYLNVSTYAVIFIIYSHMGLLSDLANNYLIIAYCEGGGQRNERH